ncbi:ComEC/Rec2 family competence protein [uncultured Microscilla sp.]|uniref:ComEC/Rec2 family competence protein n=1 Tax=uncultured Microscilla sp. TaxID=432653 RepID=UPI0026299847|nr:ComEC/Rec2 family competence protein [uncultured Microscilla sp.]
MFKWTSYAFVRFTFFFILGICFGLYKPPTSIKLWHLLFYGSGAAYIVVFFISRFFHRFAFTPVTGCLAGLMLFCFGILRTFQVTEAHHPQHLLHQPDTITHYLAVVQNSLQKKTKSYRTRLRVYQAKVKGNWVPAVGQVLLYIKKDSLAPVPRLQYGQVLLVQGTPLRVAPPKNPEQFNYRRYLAQQNIHHQHFATSLNYQVIDTSSVHSVLTLSETLRSYCDAQLKALVKGSQEYGIATALLLGVKDHIDSDIKNAYSGAGLMHLLAVSGLHIGFIYLILHLLLKPLKQLPGGELWYLLTMVGCLWLYAFITGLSASVMRAVTMFSVMAVAKATNRRTNIYNTLAVSAFALLVYNPLMVTSVGFQLSYIAVAGIVYIQPKVYQWLHFTHWLPDYLWQLTSVSIAAQIATFPLALYYFHQFPNYFLLSNLLVLPLAPVLLVLGIFTLLLSFVPWLSEILGYLLRLFIETLNMVIVALNKLPLAITEGIYLRTADLWLIYVSVISFFWVFQYKKLYYLKISVGCILVLAGARLYNNHQCQQQQEFAIFQLNKHPHLQFTQGTQSFFIAKAGLQHEHQTLGFNIDTYLWSKGIRQRVFLDARQNQENKEIGFAYRKKEKYALLYWRSKSFLILQKYLRYRELKKFKSIKTDYLIIQNRAVWSLARLCKVIQPTHIIIDDSNGFYRGRKLYKEAQHLGVPCTWITQNGAFILRQ